MDSTRRTSFWSDGEEHDFGQREGGGQGFQTHPFLLGVKKCSKEDVSFKAVLCSSLDPAKFGYMGPEDFFKIAAWFCRQTRSFDQLQSRRGFVRPGFGQTRPPSLSLLVRFG